MARRTSSSTHGTTQVGRWLSLGFFAVIAGSLAVTAARMAVAAPALGNQDGVGFGAILGAMVSLSLGAATASAVANRWRRGSTDRLLATVIVVVSLGAGALVSGYLVDNAAESRVRGLTTNLTLSEGLPEIRDLPPYTEDYFYSPTPKSLGARLDRGVDAYLGQFGVPMLIAALAIGGSAGWLVGQQLPLRARKPRPARRATAAAATVPIEKIGSLETKANVDEVAFARVGGKNVLVARTRRGALVLDVEGGRRIADRELVHLLGLPAGSAEQAIKASLRSAQVGEPFVERADWWGAARCGTLIARPTGTNVEVWRRVSRDRSVSTDFWEGR